MHQPDAATMRVLPMLHSTQFCLQCAECLNWMSVEIKTCMHASQHVLAPERSERSEGWLPWASSGASEMPSCRQKRHPLAGKPTHRWATRSEDAEQPASSCAARLWPDSELLHIVQVEEGQRRTCPLLSFFFAMCFFAARFWLA